MSHASAWRFWRRRRLFVWAINFISLDGFSAFGNASSALSLKTLPQSVFTRLRRARSLRIPPSFFLQNQKHPQGCFWFWRRRRLFVWAINFISLDGFSAVGFLSSALSLKTLPRSVFTRLRRARSLRIPPSFFLQNQKHPQGVLLVLAETAGFEPAGDCSLTDFESAPL